MKSSTVDHLKYKATPGLFRLFSSTQQEESVLDKVYLYVYGKAKWESPVMTTCRGPMPGSYKEVTLGQIQGEFDSYKPEVQKTILDRVNQYVIDFKSSAVFSPTQEALERLLAVQDYFLTHIKQDVLDSTFQNQPT